MSNLPTITFPRKSVSQLLASLTIFPRFDASTIVLPEVEDVKGPAELDAEAWGTTLDQLRDTFDSMAKDVDNGARTRRHSHT